MAITDVANVIMEPKEEIKVAVLEVKMETLNTSVTTLGTKIDNLTDKIDNNYTKKEEFNEFKNKEFNPIRQEVEKIRFFLAKVTGIAIAVAVIVDYVFRVLTKN